MNENELAKYQKDKAAIVSIVKYLLVVAVISVFIIFATKVVIVMLPFLLGFLLAKTSFILSNKMIPNSTGIQNNNKRKKLSIIIYVIMNIVLSGLFIFAGVAAISQIINAIKNISVYVSEFDYSSINFSFLERFTRTNGSILPEEMVASIEDSYSSVVSKVLNLIPGIITGFVSSVLSAIGNIPFAIFFVISVILSGYYFLKDTPNVLRFYYRTVPNRSFRKKFLSLLNELSLTLFNVLGGYLVLMFLTFVEAYIIFLFAGVKYSVILAIITSLIDFLPVLGVSATMVPLIIYNFLHGNYVAAIILIIGITSMTIIRRFVEPLILGQSMKIHPLLMLISMAAGVYIWGAIGFLVGPTVFIIIIQVTKVFSWDKKFLEFFSYVLGKVMDDSDLDADKTPANKKTSASSKKH